VVLIGLAAKNGILIVQLVKEKHRHDAPLLEQRRRARVYASGRKLEDQIVPHQSMSTDYQERTVAHKQRHRPAK
jgi:hypothetical protein